MNQTPVVTCADGGEGHGGEGVPEARLQSVFDHLGDFDQVRLSDQMKDRSFYTSGSPAASGLFRRSAERLRETSTWVTEPFNIICFMFHFRLG